MSDRVRADALPITIEPATLDDLPVLERHLHRGFPQRHRPCIERQIDGKGVYLIVWLDDIPIGHAHIAWAWQPDHPDAMADLLHGQTIVMDVYIVDELRSRGIGSRLLLAIDDQARQRNVPLIGLGVATDNSRARALYERHGFVDAGLGAFLTGWEEPDEHGQPRWVEEWEYCMIKRYR